MTASDSRNAALVLYRPMVEKLVAALGALVTHQIGYLIASLIGVTVASPSDHGHLSTQWAVVAPLAIGAASLFIVRQLRVLGFRSLISVRKLSGLVIVFFMIQESVEGFLGGVPLAELVRHPAIIAGILVAPLVAWLLCRLLDGVTELAAKLLVDRALLVPVTKPRLIPLPVRYRTAGRGSPSRPRAPPSSRRS